MATPMVRQARLLMESAQAIRDYTSEEIAPALDRLQDEKFYPQSVSAYAAVHYFEALHKKNPEFTYREPALNPTNPAHRATDWEADIINDFRNNPSKTELVTERHPWRPRPELVASSRRHQELPSLPRHA